MSSDSGFNLVPQVVATTKMSRLESTVWACTFAESITRVPDPQTATIRANQAVEGLRKCDVPSEGTALPANVRERSLWAALYAQDVMTGTAPNEAVIFADNGLTTLRQVTDLPKGGR